MELKKKSNVNWMCTFKNGIVEKGTVIIQSKRHHKNNPWFMVITIFGRQEYIIYHNGTYKQILLSWLYKNELKYILFDQW